MLHFLPGDYRLSQSDNFINKPGWPSAIWITNRPFFISWLCQQKEFEDLFGSKDFSDQFLSENLKGAMYKICPSVKGKSEQIQGSTAANCCSQHNAAEIMFFYFSGQQGSEHHADSLNKSQWDFSFRFWIIAENQLSGAQRFMIVTYFVQQDNHK